MSKAKSISRGVTPFVLAGGLLAGCASPHSAEKVGSSTTSTSLPTDQQVAEAPVSSHAYQTNPDRDSVISSAVGSFGAVILEQSTLASSPWGPFDTFCSTVSGEGTNPVQIPEGSQPIPGDSCEVAHVPEYGGANLVVATEVIIGYGGPETDDFTGVRLYDSNCSLDAINQGPSVGWEVRIGQGDASPLNDTAKSNWFSEAVIIDRQALYCLSTTQP